MSQPLTVVDEVGDTSRVSLSKAILLYKSPSQCVATVHEIMQNEGQPPLLLPGKGLSWQGLQDLIVAMTGGEQASVFLSPGVLVTSLTRLVWWCPSQVRPIWFKTDNGRLHRLNGCSVTHPNLVFAATAKGLSVWALAEDERPTPQTPLFHAPYFNVWDSGSVCRGNIHLPQLLAPSSIDQFERAFFETNFTHANHPDLTRHPRGHDGFWRDLRSKRKKRIPRRWLVPTQRTLHSILNHP
jgi:PRTRC genetic system protein B